MTDQEFLKAFEDCSLTEFHHRDHIRMAWLYLREFGYEKGSSKVAEGIRRFAATKNQNRLYHETITQFWIRLVQHVIENHTPAKDFAEFINSFPRLSDSKSIFRHYSRDLLMSESARLQCQEPDLMRFE